MMHPAAETLMIAQMLSPTQKRALERTGCDVRFDDHTREMFATDGSIYQVEPLGAAFPKTPPETQALFAAAFEHDVPLIPRGAGTGLAGGALGRGLVVDFSRYQRQIAGYDAESETIHVRSGVVLDQLNDFLKAYRRTFGPDVATSSRATIGGMVANNSSGARAPFYGTTLDHVESLDVVLADGTAATIGPGHPALPHVRDAVTGVIAGIENEINERFPEGLVKRWPGYGVARWQRVREELIELIGGSEGALAAITGAHLKTMPLPQQQGIGLIFFASVAEAMEATVSLLELNPVAIEHIDDVLFNQTKNQLQFQKARALLELDEKPCEAILIVEFYEDVEGKLRALEEKNFGLRTATFTEPEAMNRVWGIRKAGLTLLTGSVGPAKPVAGIEDVAVRPRVLPEYVKGLRELMEPLGMRASFYGHAASGLLHVRPVVDLHKREDIEKFRKVAEGVSALTKQFKGSIAAEHGVGIARAEFLEDHLGPEIMNAFRAIKAAFDPKGLMNPGKLTADTPLRIDGDLRWGENYEVPLPFEPKLAFAFKDGSFVGNLEQCNGCGGCRKDAPTMCPTFIATGEEIMSTRGRANTIRAVLDGRLREDGAALVNDSLHEALAYCLSCKACTPECPSNVNLALLKAELLHAKQQERGLTLQDRMVSRVDALSAIASLAPGVANAVLGWPVTRWFMEKSAGFDRRRAFPTYAPQRFDRWFEQWEPAPRRDRGKVLLWDDCFTRYNDPHIGRTAVRVLEAAGYEVEVIKDRACCGRPAFSTGRLDVAAEFGSYNLNLIQKTGDSAPIVFLEPSCYSMFAEDYRELGLGGAEEVKGRAQLFERFLGDLLEADFNALFFEDAPRAAAVHVHCHAKSIHDAGLVERVLSKMPQTQVTTLDTACCGMAGAYGQLKEKYDVSVQVGQHVVDQVNALPADTAVIATGTSCRHQLAHLSTRTPQHVVEFVAAALAQVRPAEAH